MYARKNLLLYSISLLILSVGISFIVTHIVRGAPAQEKETTISPQEPGEILPIEKSGYFTINSTLREPSLNSTACLVTDAETGQVLLSKNSNARYAIASVTKLMTALVSVETLPQDLTTTVSKETLETEGWRGDFVPGQKITVKELIYPLLLVSSNDAGEALARFQGRERFIVQMNERALELGMLNSTFADPTGLSPLNISTPEDLMILLNHITITHPEIFEVSQSDYYSGEESMWQNVNRLRSEKTFIGGKTGYTSVARQTGAGMYKVTFAGGEERTLALVILQSNSREADIHRLITYLEKNIFYGTALDFADHIANL